MYTATPTQKFMNKCKEMDVDWAIFSDKYGVWHSTGKHDGTKRTQIKSQISNLKNW